MAPPRTPAAPAAKTTKVGFVDLREVDLQCAACKDLFSLEVDPIERRLVPDTRVGMVAGELRHRPGVCGGAVRLIVPR